MGKLHPLKHTKVKYPNSLNVDQLNDLCLDELVYHLNSINKYICNTYYDESSKTGVTGPDIAYLLLVQTEFSRRLLLSGLY